MDRDLKYVVDMWSAASRITERTHGRTRDDMDSDLLLQETAYWQTCVLGEAAGHLSDSFRAAHPDQPWHRVTGLRHRIIHGYGDIDNDIVWSVVTEHIPPLAAFLEELVPFGTPNHA